MAWDINVPVGALYGQSVPKSPADLRDVLTGIARDVANSPEVGNPGEIPDDLGFLRDYLPQDTPAFAPGQPSPYADAVKSANPLFEQARTQMASAAQMTPPAPTTPAFRTQDLLTGLAPMLLASLVGPSAQREGNANAYGQGYLQGKQLKAQQDTEAAQNAFRAQQQGQIAAAQGLNQQGQQILDQGVRQQSILDTQSKLKAEERKQTTDQIIKARTAFQTAAKGDNVAAIDAAANDLKSLGAPVPDSVVESAKQQINSKLNTKVLAQLSKLGPNFSEDMAKAAFMERGLSEEDAAAKAKALVNSPTRKMTQDQITNLRKTVNDDVKNSFEARVQAALALKKLGDPQYENMGIDEITATLKVPSPVLQQLEERTKVLAQTSQKIQAEIHLTQAKANQIAAATAYLPEEKRMQIAKGYAQINALRNLMDTRSAKVDIEQARAALTSSKDATNSLSQHVNNLNASIVKAQGQLAKMTDPSDPQYLQLQKSIETMTAERDEASPVLAEMRNGLPYATAKVAAQEKKIKAMSAIVGGVDLSGVIGQGSPFAPVNPAGPPRGPQPAPAGGWNNLGGGIKFRKKGG